MKIEKITPVTKSNNNSKHRDGNQSKQNNSNKDDFKKKLEDAMNKDK